MQMVSEEERRQSQRSAGSSFVDAFRETLRGINIDSSLVEQELKSFQQKKGSRGKQSEGTPPKKVARAPSTSSSESSDLKKRSSVKGRSEEKLLSGKKVDADFMTVKVSRVRPSERTHFSVAYPYRRLKERCTAYRGYPVDGGDSMKKYQEWKVQIAPPALGLPPETLPAFPEIACLQTTRSGEYSLKEKMRLSKQQMVYNSGNAWLLKGNSPSAKYYYAAGCLRGEPVRLKSPFKDKSIYRSAHKGKVPIFAPENMGFSETTSSTSKDSHSTRESARD